MPTRVRIGALLLSRTGRDLRIAAGDQGGHTANASSGDGRLPRSFEEPAARSTAGDTTSHPPADPTTADGVHITEQVRHAVEPASSLGDAHKSFCFASVSHSADRVCQKRWPGIRVDIVNRSWSHEFAEQPYTVALMPSWLGCATRWRLSWR